MAEGDQQFKVFLSFKDEASPKFIKATEEQIAAIKKVGLAVKKEGKGIIVDLEKMADNTEKLKNSHKRFGSELSNVMRSLGSIRNMILVYMFALRPLFDLVKDSTKAYIEQEDALARLNYALGLQGTSAGIVDKQLVDLSKTFQETTRYGHTMILEVMDKLVTLGNIMPSELEKVTKAVLDFSSVTKRDPVEAADLFARASNGITTGLRRAGIVIDQSTPKAKVLAEAIKYVNENMGGRAHADILTYGGKLAQLTNNINLLKESVGGLISKGLNLPYVVSFWGKVFSDMDKAVTGEGVTALNTLQKTLDNVNKKIQAMDKQKPVFSFLGLEALNKEEYANLIVQRDETINAIQYENQFQANQKIITEQAIAEERVKQLKIKAQDDFNVAYQSIERVRIDTEISALIEDYNRYKLYVEDKKALDEWYQSGRRKIHAEELALEKKDPKLENLDRARESMEKYISGSEKYVDSVTKAITLVHGQSEAYLTFMKGFASAGADAIKNGFVDIIKGEFKGLGNVLKSFGDTMLNLLMEIAAKAAMVRFGFAAFLGIAHTGGYILNQESSFAYRKKFHSGGEVPAMLLEGEGVLSRTGMRSLGVDNLNRLNRGESAGGGQTVNNYYIDAIDVKSFRDRLQQHGDIYVSAADGSIKDNSAYRRTVQRFGG